MTGRVAPQEDPLAVLTSLPQDVAPAHRALRNAQLRDRRERYRFDRTGLPPFVLSDGVPAEESFTVEYHAALVDLVLLAGRSLAQAGLVDPGARLGASDYARLFTLLPRPERILNIGWKDTSFAEQRLSGPNPMVLRRVKHRDDLSALQEKMSLTTEHVQVSLAPSGGGAWSLERLVEEGRLFCCDYSILRDLPAGSWSGGRKYLAAPIALFVRRPTGHGCVDELVPVAIQLGQQRDAWPVITPDRDPEWRLAKLHVQVADANHHEMAAHLAWTHLAMEPFAIATGRRLAAEHPVHRLLASHFRFLIAKNHEARLRLINPDGPVDNLLASTLDGSLEIARRAMFGGQGQAPWSLSSHAFPTELADRGLDDPAFLSHHPYRDDGLLLWRAIGDFVDRYLAVYYRQPGSVLEDEEIQSWARELADARDGAGVRGIPDRISDRQTLGKLLTAIVFTCGPQHAATNYPQYEYMAPAVNMPLAAYAPVPTALGGAAIDPGLFAGTLPPAGAAAQQLLIMFSMSGFRPDRLGEYAADAFGAEATECIGGFQRALVAAEKEIQRRNVARRVPYIYLQPSLVPNATSM